MGFYFSVIIPVLNEAATINDTIRHLRCSNPSIQFEVIVADGHPRRTTLSAITVNDVIKTSGPMGRGAQMNAGAALARGKILLFLHADTVLEPGALKKIIGVVHEKNFEAGAFQLAIRSDRRVFRIIEFGVKLRTKITRIPYGDQAIFISRVLFDRVGGYPEIPIMEDVELMQRVRKIGGEVRILKERAFTSSRRWEKEGVVYCTLRNWILSLLYRCGIPASSLARYYLTPL